MDMLKQMKRQSQVKWGKLSAHYREWCLDRGKEDCSLGVEVAGGVILEAVLFVPDLDKLGLRCSIELNLRRKSLIIERETYQRGPQLSVWDSLGKREQ